MPKRPLSDHINRYAPLSLRIAGTAFLLFTLMFMISVPRGIASSFALLTSAMVSALPLAIGVFLIAMAVMWVRGKLAA